MSAADVERRRGLRRMRSVAFGLLVLAAVVYVLTLHRGDPWTFVHATAEAAMVGAIADWFAVTAIFRHPMGIPIPHTALIPTRKRMLARSLQEFVGENFLHEAVVRRRVADAEVSRRLGQWLAEEEHSRRVVSEAATLTRAALSRLDDDDLEALLGGELLPRLADEPLAAIAGQLLADVVDDAAHVGLVDLVLDEAHRWLVVNKETFGRVVRTRAPWWSPTWLDEKVADRLHLEIVAWVADIRADRAHSARAAFDDLLRKLATDLQHDPDTMHRAERLKARLLGQPQVLETAMSLWRAFRRALDVTLGDPESGLRRRAAVKLAAFGVTLQSDRALQQRLDTRAADVATFIVNRYGTELTTVITDTIDRWDGREAARRIELHVGRDLQFIRINGTVVGGLAGLVIYTISRLL